MKTVSAVAALALSAICALAPAHASAQGDEIQVYDGGLAPVGKFNLTWHNNYTPSGIRTPSFNGAVTSHQSLNGVPEWALGVTDWFEAGLYMPLYSIDKDLGFKIDGFKLRTLFAVPHADDRKFFYGANFEFSINAKHWDQKRFTSEIRPIIGWHFRPVDFIVNPIVDTNYTGGIKGLEIVPSARLAYNVSSEWAIAAEEYAGLGTVGDLASRHFQGHQLFGVIDHAGKAFDLEFGAGIGLTDVSDKFQLKLILSKDLN
jgi:hypothetical protein